MNMSIDDLASSEAFGGNKGRREQITWLPEPEPRERVYTVISVDDHVVEPPDAFTGRFPKRFADDEPRVVDTDDGGEAWVWQGQQLPNVGFNAVVGRPSSEYGFEPTRFDEMRRGAWDVNARVADMDIDGVWASLCFPSFLPGFVGQRLTMWPDSDELALVAMRAVQRLAPRSVVRRASRIGSSRTRSRTCAIPRSRPRRSGATPARGFKAVTFSEAPDKLGLPTIHSGYWDPLFAACAETGTVLCLHVGSSGTSPTTSPDAPPEIPAVLFGAYGMYSAVDWLYSKVPVRFPDIRICLSEGGIGWVAGILDRLDHCYRYQLGYLPTWRDVDRVAERGDAPQLLVLRARRRRRHARARPHRRRPHPRGVRLPARRLVVARHAGDARAPAPRSGRARRTTRAASRGRTRRSCSGIRFPTRSGGDRHDRVASSRARTPRATRRRSRSSRSRSGATMTWREYDERSSRMAATLRARATRRATASRSSSPTDPACTRRCSRARRPASSRVGIGSRAGAREVEHLVERTGAAHAAHRPSLPATGAGEPARPIARRDELWFLNSTSGTTGLPKIVMHNQARWFAFHGFAQRIAGFTPDDVFLERAARAVRLRPVDRALHARRSSARRASCARASTPRRCSPRSSATASPCSPRSRRSS